MLWYGTLPLFTAAFYITIFSLIFFKKSSGQPEFVMGQLRTGFVTAVSNAVE